MSLYEKVKDSTPWEPLNGDTKHKMYILVRGDLSKSQQAVQACHAIAQNCLEGRNVGFEYGWKNGTVVLLKVKDLIDVVCWRENLTAKGYDVAQFKEPYFNNETTAIAVTGNGLEDLLSHLPLV